MSNLTRVKTEILNMIIFKCTTIFCPKKILMYFKMVYIQNARSYFLSFSLKGSKKNLERTTLSCTNRT